MEANKDRSPPLGWDLEPVAEKFWTEYEPACKTDADCPRPDLGQVCTKLYWQATKNKKNFTNGENCDNWSYPVCPGKEFASINYNYENTNFSYYTQMKCTSGESGASALALASASLIALLSMF